MKKKIIILLIIILSIFILPIKAEEKLKSVEYETVINDNAGVNIKGTYKDENNNEKEISLNIPYNEKIKVLYECMKDNALYGYVKYATTITVKVEDTSRNNANVRPDSPRPNTSNNSGVYNDSRNTSNITKTDNGTVGNRDENVIKYKEVKKDIEVEGYVDLSKCKVDSEFPLDKAIKFNETRKIKIVKNSGIVLYKGPAFGYEKLSYIIPANTELEYNYGSFNLDQSNNDVAWVYVESENFKGWIYKGLLDSGVAEYKKGRLLSFGNTSIKELPSDISKEVQTLPKGLRKSFTYIYGIQDASNDEWYYIEYKGKKGWVKNVAIGVNAEITIKNNTKLYEKPNLDVALDNIVLNKGTKLISIYKYSKNIDAFYVEYKGKKGWIKLDKKNPDFMVNYLEDNVVDKFLNKDKTEVEKKQKNSSINPIIIILILFIIIIIIVVVIFMTIKKKRKQSNDFVVHQSDLTRIEEKSKVTLINRNRMGR